jgi:hypothetical protein
MLRFNAPNRTPTLYLLKARPWLTHYNFSFRARSLTYHYRQDFLTQIRQGHFILLDQGQSCGLAVGSV